MVGCVPGGTPKKGRVLGVTSVYWAWWRGRGSSEYVYLCQNRGLGGPCSDTNTHPHNCSTWNALQTHINSVLSE